MMTSTDPTVLVTGGAGFIGSHTTLALLQAGQAVVVLDNLSNSSAQSLERVARIAGRAPVFVQGDVRDRALVQRLLREHRAGSVLHFAGLKAVGESASMPHRIARLAMNLENMISASDTGEVSRN